MKQIITTLLFCCCSLFLFAQQPQRAIFHPEIHAKSKLSNTIVIPIKAQPFLAYSLMQTWQDANIPEAFQIRFSEDEKTWTPWESLQQDQHNTTDEPKWASQLLYTSKTHRFFQYRWIAEVLPRQLELHFYSPDDSPIQLTDNSSNLTARSTCGCEQPDFQSRADWCSNCPEGASPAEHQVTHLIIHHSAGTNEADDWAAIVRSIWDFHVNGREWDDIAYNWLIDPNGVLYAGRATDIRGAHFCGKNTGTEGVCVLGDFTEVAPTDTARQTLSELWAWKACDRDLNPLEETRHNASSRNLFPISGHRDGCATACPGDMFYPLLEEVRQGVVDYQEENCNLVSTVEEFKKSIKIFPNPAQQHLNITLVDAWQGTLQLQIRTMTGKLLQETELHSQRSIRLDIANLTNGIYILSMKNGTQQATFKVLKMD